MPSSQPSESILGDSPWAVAIRHRIEQIARHRYPIVITGPPGTGKQFLSRVLHALSPRNEKPLIPVDCSKFGEHSFASQMFGHTGGGIAGVGAPTLGVLRAADGGTLFLGRIDSLSIEMQQQLLEVLKSKQVTPLGGEKAISFDVRLIASSLSDLQKEVQGRCFLPELYTLLEAVSLATVPLVERSEDFGPLADFFLKELADDLEEPPRRLTPGAEQYLKKYSWPGNVLELQHVLERVALDSEREELDAGDFAFLFEGE